MPALGAPIILDATHGEGGGALLRTALSMAALTQQPMVAKGVRGESKYPGLSSEDVTIIRALASMCRAETVGATVGSNDISFLPTRRPAALNGTLEWLEDNEEPTSVGTLVVLNTLAPLLARAGAYSSVSVYGETYGHGILSYDYFANVTVEAMKRLGLYSFPELLRAGYGRNSIGQATLDHIGKRGT